MFLIYEIDIAIELFLDKGCNFLLVLSLFLFYLRFLPVGAPYFMRS